MATLPKVLINRADYQIGGGVRGEDTALRTFGNYRSRIEADDFGRGIKGMIAACTMHPYWAVIAFLRESGELI
jgi:hypothetical protein